MSEIALIFQLVSTTIMVIGVIFGVQNIRQFQAGRKRESAIMMLNSFQTGEFVRGLMYILNAPGGLSKADVDRLPPDQFQAILIVIGTWERLGVLVFRREIDLELVDDAFSGPVIQSWEKLSPYIQEFRAQMSRDTAMEWFQWLAERMQERETQNEPTPAYIAHRKWTP
ncbi:MAG TPA: DUF4760 domain-containing protein [Anaerolineales bacterium]|jgi:hypothetical protein